MAGRRCVLHGTFPAEYRFSDCPVCGERTSYADNIEPDENWAENIERHRKRIAEAEEEVELIPTLENVKVMVEAGQFYIDSRDAIRAGFQDRLRPSELVRIGKQVFEVLHYSYEKRRYLVQVFSLTLTDEQLADLATPPVDV